MKKKKVVFLLGPTAVGKTYFGVEMAKLFDGEIISADSVQIYRRLDIGSAKVTSDEMQGVVHHGIDILEPNEEFSVYEFVQYTKKKIDEILAKGKLPIVVGGTGLYIKALVLGYNFGGVDKDKNLRIELENLAKEKGNDFLFELLSQKNPQMAEKTDKHNTVRLVRALEIALSSGEKEQSEVDIDPLVVALVRDREILYQAINERVEQMFDNGLLQEVQNLKNEGLTKENQSMKAIGYKEVLPFLDGEYDLEKAKELIKQHSRNYAKRQLTFLRGMKDVHFVQVENKEQTKKEISSLIQNWIEK